MRPIHRLERNRHRNKGFTFLEMALTLFSIGFLLSALPGLLSLSKVPQSLASSPAAAPADAAEFALNGFIFTKSRLPCPSATPLSGEENCAITKGFVPYTALGLPRPVTNGDGQPFAYGMLADLGQATAKYTPQYLVSTDNYWETAPTRTSNQVNGFDFCAKLRSPAALAVDTNLLNIRNWNDRTNETKMTNVAWVLVDPGNRGTDGAAGKYPVFNGGNDPSSSGMSFESPSRVQSPTYGDKVRVATLTQLFGELHCPELLASASAAAREADFANDDWRVRKYLYDFVTYERLVREQKETQAGYTVALAAFNLSQTVTTAALGLGVGLASGSGASAIAILAVTSAIGVATAVYGVGSAAKGLADAAAKVAEVKVRQTNATAAVTDANNLRQARYAALQLLDQRGWFQ